MQVGLRFDAEAPAAQLTERAVGQTRMTVGDLIAQLLEGVAPCERAREALPKHLLPGRARLAGLGPGTLAVLDPLLALEALDVTHRVAEGILVVDPGQDPAPFAQSHPV